VKDREVCELSLSLRQGSNHHKFLLTLRVIATKVQLNISVHASDL
jgi:hypothetical protein